MIPSFNFARIPQILFGTGSLCKLFEIIPRYGAKVLIVTGGSSLKDSGRWDEGRISEVYEWQRIR